MCLAIPMQITAIDGLNAQCQARGAERQVSLWLLQDDPPAVGDFVMVSMAQAQRQMSAEDARQSWELYDQILATLDGQAAAD